MSLDQLFVPIALTSKIIALVAQVAARRLDASVGMSGLISTTFVSNRKVR